MGRAPLLTDQGQPAGAPVGTVPARADIDPQSVAQMHHDVETIVGFLRDGMDNTRQRLVVSMARKWANQDSVATAGAESSPRQRYPHLSKFMVLLQERAYSRGSWWRDAYGIVYGDLQHELKDDRLSEFTALAGECDAGPTSGSPLADQDNVFSYIGKREAVGLWGLLKGMGTTIVGGTVDTVIWATWKQTGEPLGKVLDRLGIHVEALKSAPKIIPFLEKSFEDTAAIMGRWLDVDIHEKLDLGFATIGTYEFGTATGKGVGGLVMAGAGAGSAGKAVESGLKVVGAMSSLQGLDQLGETISKLRHGDPNAGIPPLTWAQIATRADLWAQVAAAAGGAVGTGGVNKLAVTLGIQGGQQVVLATAFHQVDDDPRYPTPDARHAQKVELFTQIVVNGATSIDQLHHAATARRHPLGEKDSVIGDEPERAGITADPNNRDELFGPANPAPERATPATKPADPTSGAPAATEAAGSATPDVSLPDSKKPLSVSKARASADAADRVAQKAARVRAAADQKVAEARYALAAARKRLSALPPVNESIPLAASKKKLPQSELDRREAERRVDAATPALESAEARAKAAVDRHEQTQAEAARRRAVLDTAERVATARDEIRAKVGSDTEADRTREAWQRQDRPDQAADFGARAGENLHHAIELQVLDIPEFAGAFSPGELRSAKNIRLIPREVSSADESLLQAARTTPGGKLSPKVAEAVTTTTTTQPDGSTREMPILENWKQKDRPARLHQGKIRTLWDRAYGQIKANLAAEQAAGRCLPGTPEHRSFVRSQLENSRDYIDWTLNPFWGETKRDAGLR